LKEKKVKKHFILMMILLSFVFTACSQNENILPSGAEQMVTGEKKPIWIENAKLNETETPEELYEKAKQEGKVVVYSQSSRIMDVKSSFEKQYPGIKVEAYDISTNEMIEKLIREQEAGLYNVDVVFIKDSGGMVSNELVKDKRLHRYVPRDIEDKLGEQFKDSPGYPYYFSSRVVFYNTEIYDEAPVSNWWDLTDPKWKSKVVIDDPLLSADMLELLVAFVQNSEDMAAAYKEKYGEELQLNDTENAGYEFIKRFLGNNPILVKSTDDVVEAVGAPGQSEPPLGISTSSKARYIEDEGLKMSYIYDMSPKMSIPTTAYLYVADQAANINAAKLMIRWMAGEADGKGEGFSPFNVLGSWSTRADIILEEQPLIKDLNLWSYDADFYYKNIQKVKDFILMNQ